MKTPEIAIIGAGPAGIACAIQLGRFGYNPAIYEKGEIGGLMNNANFIENYPGFPFGVSPEYLSESFVKHLVKYEIDLKYQEITSAEYGHGKFILRTRHGAGSYDVLVIASGTRPRRHRKFEQQGKDKVFYELLPLRKARGKEIAIIGGGDAAFDYALSLALNNQVKIFNRSDKTICLPMLFERCKKNVRIQYFPNTVLQSLKDSGHFLTGEFKSKEEELAFSMDYIIFATGRDPETGFLGDSLKKHQEKLIAAGILHLIGDVKNERYRQVAIAAGDGIRAAMEINEALKKTR